MALTVPAASASGGRVLPLALLKPAVPAAPAIHEQPATWSFTNIETGETLAVTCMPGCESEHQAGTAQIPVDVWCQTDRGGDVALPVDRTGTPEETRLLAASINALPFDAQMSRRLPHVNVEVIDGAWLTGLDPDALEDVIDTLEERVAALREAHAELLRVRAAHKATR